jgi:hypothetical protein
MESAAIKSLIETAFCNYLVVKKEFEKELVGLLVLINPAASVGEANKTNKFGHVLSVSADQTKVQVVFSGRNIESYHPRDLLTLQTEKVILKGLLADWDISNSDCRIILQSLKLLSKNNYEEAMKLAMTNNITRSFCVVKLSTCLSLSQPIIRQAKKSKRIN